MSANFDVTQGAGKTIGAIDVAGGGVLVQSVAEVAFDDKGWSVYSRIATNDTNAYCVKASSGVVHAIYATNVNAAVRYLKLYDKATTPTVGTDTPVFRVGLTGGTTGILTALSGLNLDFVNGIGIGVVTALADNSTAAPSANDFLLNIEYL